MIHAVLFQSRSGQLERARKAPCEVASVQAHRPGALQAASREHDEDCRRCLCYDVVPYFVDVFAGSQ